jgi:hypothetical protein
MPLITNPYSCSKHQSLIIRNKLLESNFNHKDWNSDDLENIRSDIRQHYRNEQNGLCAYCKNIISFRSASNAHIEHIAPKSIYLDFIFETKNLCVVCADCNEIKRNQEVLSAIPDTIKPLSGGIARKIYPRSSGAFLIIHPHFDDWDDHLIKFGHQYTDKSEKGAFTILACKLNRYFHQVFNMDDSFVNDEILVEKMKAYIESGSSLQRTKILEDLKKDLSKSL